jgi:hypothetical protein
MGHFVHQFVSIVSKKSKAMQAGIAKPKKCAEKFAGSGDKNRQYRVMTPAEPETKFVPRGAIFFFALLLVFYAALWGVIYWLMIARS